MNRRALGAVAVAATACTALAFSPGKTSRPPILFAADRAPAVTGEIYRVTLDGRRLDLSRSPFLDTDPLVSPDGRRVAFFSDRGAPAGRFRLWVVGIDGDVLKPASSLLSSDQMPQLAWSPDSRRLAVVVATRRYPLQMGLYVIDPDRGQRLVLHAPTLVEPAWSPDGRLLTVSGVVLQAVTPAGRKAWWAPRGQFAWSARGRLAVACAGRVRVYDEEGRMLTTFPGRSFAWSPNEDRLASVTADRLEVHDGSGRLLFRRRVRGLASTQSNGLVWADAHRIVIGGIGEGRIGVDLRTGRTWAPSDGWFAIRSPDGQLVAETGSLGGAYDLRVARFAGSPGRPRTLARIRGCLDDGGLTGVTSVQFTPDSRSLVYQSNCPEAYDNLYTVSPAGQLPRRLTHVVAQESSPEWSPDASAIVYSRADYTGLSCKGCASSIWVARDDGSQPRRLTNPPDCTYDDSPSWSPGGAAIVFSRSSCTVPSELFAVPATGGPARDLHVPGTEPAWGPSRIAYLQLGHDPPSLWTTRPDGSERRRVTAGQLLSSPTWSRAGRLAALDQDRLGVSLVEALGTSVRRIRLPFVEARGLAWSPDGSRLALAARRQPNGPFDVYTVRSDGGGLRRLTWNMGASSVSWAR